MTAHALPYSPGELVRQCAEARAPLHEQLAAIVLRKAPQFIVDIVGLYLVGEVDRIAMRLSATTLELESLAERVSNSPQDSLLDKDDVLYAVLASQEERMRTSADEVRAAWQPLHVGSRRRAAVRIAALRMADAALAAAAAARNLRGVIQAHDANVSAVRQARRVCATPAELDEALDLPSH